MAERRVRTPEGARLFGQPIGAVIDDRANPHAAETKRATSIVRLRSLQRQFDAAKRVGDLGRMKHIQNEFSAMLKDFSGSTQWMDTLEDLVSARGRNDQALGKKKNLDD